MNLAIVKMIVVKFKKIQETKEYSNFKPPIWCTVCTEVKIYKIEQLIIKIYTTMFTFIVMRLARYYYEIYHTYFHR